MDKTRINRHQRTHQAVMAFTQRSNTSSVIPAQVNQFNRTDNNG